MVLITVDRHINVSKDMLMICPCIMIETVLLCVVLLAMGVVVDVVGAHGVIPGLEFKT